MIQSNSALQATDGSPSQIAAPLPLLIAILFVGLWLVLAPLLSTAQWGDNIEQFNWAHSLEFGYWKHPPLSTWFLAGFQQLFGFHLQNTYVISFLCLGATLYFVWRIAGELLPRDWAGLSVMLLGLHLMFAGRAQLYNHNVALILMVSCTVWLSIWAVLHTRPRTWHWILVGASAGLALLAKYQAIVPLLGIVLAFEFSDVNRKVPVRRGMLIAVGSAILVCLPHMVWVVQTDFMIMHYATSSATGARWFERLTNLLSFYIQQIRFNWLMLLGLAIAIGVKALVRPVSKANLATPDKIRQPSIRLNPRVWFWGLLYFPIIASVVLNQLCGVQLQNHWGVEFLLFLPLWISWQLSRRGFSIDLPKVICTLVIIQLLAMGLFTLKSAKSAQSMLKDSGRRNDTHYPANQMAERALAAWQAQTKCPLKFIAGSAFESGLISVYSGQYPAVVEDDDFNKSPWVKPAELIESGKLSIHDDMTAPDGFSLVVTLPLKNCL